MPSSTPPSRASEVRLHRVRWGNGPRIVFAHGFTQTHKIWNGIDQALATDHQVMAVDMPGHGGSSSVAADLIEAAHLLGEAGGRGTYIGYSMGARVALHLALAEPAEVRSLVLISGTAGLEDAQDRAQRRASDEVLANQLDPTFSTDDPAELRIDSQDRVDAFLLRWLANPLFEGISDEANSLEERRRNTGPGLASSLRLAGTGTQLPLWNRLHQLAMPVLLITGELDEKFSSLGQRMADTIGINATQVVISGAGHAPHLQQPGDVVRSIRQHLNGLVDDG